MLTVTIDPGLNLTPVPGNSELFKDSVTLDPDFFPDSDIFEMFLHFLCSVIGLK